ncbi:4'-phosphopantetheinyl transferase superfamily protein [Conexibacter sp. JD483]|uniref:4'-phosphopantetheinyl transferase family protein n=1 Tax=unclassified Conexibacter TaxID=2627773 RepID=UPI0027175591|nr:MULTISPECIES: 4'-phosphopantetheinyl transferase superfamily protein [unclassified Conexibacter]MDO8184334.1 4'-phosphopantetheinyl transferase superfamily protein [Conexibacter sp. CPCC 205706]MDO8197640.1 4'-phosphopantetheinyl transferase superfamily protein [Conexibacter sp. CPCC 205762]MDR9368303.1 4'-phosphopantetheinyl transferase superfamily protein [Conexibacter sp. JD483]
MIPPPTTLAEGRPVHDLAGVRVWLVTADEPARRRLQPLLAPDELTRAGRLRNAADRDRFVVGRGLARLALATQLGIAPAAVALRTGAHGRPALGCETLDFNIAHAGALVACAVARDQRVGIDVEHLRVLRARHAFVELTCAPHERAWLESLPRRARKAALFELWTAKEACLKASGCGLLEPPSEVAVVLRPGRERLPARTLARFREERFAVHRLACPSDYRLTLATRPRRAAAAAPAGDPTARRPLRSSGSRRRADRA